jgi:uncharacterized repeat protein (TIGR03803 family)
MQAQKPSAASIFGMSLRAATVTTTLVLVFTATIVTVPAAQAQTFNVIYSFEQNAVGSEPNAGVTLDSHGNVYGTNFFYGAGYGTVYKLTYKDGVWMPTVLYEFQGGNDGAFPASRVVFGPDGALYGTTSAGGGNNCRSSGCGTVFKLTPPTSVCKTSLCPWDETILYRFTGGADGAVPEYGDLVFDSAGSIYGTTAGNYASFGSVYKLTNSGGNWTETTLWTFTGGNDGYFPTGGVTFDQASDLYGTMERRGYSSYRRPAAAGRRMLYTPLMIRSMAWVPHPTWSLTVPAISIATPSLKVPVSWAPSLSFRPQGEAGTSK